MVNKGFKTFSKASVKTKRISIMNLNFYSVFFILLTSCCYTSALYCLQCEGVRAVGRSENPGVPVLFGGHNLPPLVEIGLTDLPKFGGAMAPPAPPGTTGL